MPRMLFTSFRRLSLTLLGFTLISLVAGSASSQAPVRGHGAEAHDMELVGHDFYLFLDKDSGRPSVVYRRKRYDYGVISLGAA